ncbi:MAG TPA: hypothetical protein VKM35_10085 [Arenimonas sp.]|uniref:hypothetical protein n=1 Tax=Arenimonas sp. TaxID=1872635 RepID=UPI002BAB5317|nr:hypothetical protein [Arenimonas sp.]HMB57544.1 hypothetical protein [Arenimonas sp.]
MNLRLIACAVVGASLATIAVAKKPENPEFVQAKKEMRQLRAADAAVAITTTGDEDTFGRNVKYLGLLSSGVINLADDCTPDPSAPPGPDDHCVVTNPAPATTVFSIPDAGRILIPGKSTNSMFCHWQTPSVIYEFRNPTGVYQPNARMILTPSYTFQNSILNDPALIDPTTGLPFGGTLTVTIPGVRDAQGLQPGDARVERQAGTRTCIAGMLTKRSLMETFGLTQQQANKFFKNDTIITMNLTGSAQLVDFASIIYGTRFVGD